MCSLGADRNVGVGRQGCDLLLFFLSDMQYGVNQRITDGWGRALTNAAISPVLIAARGPQRLPEPCEAFRRPVRRDTLGVGRPQ